MNRLNKLYGEILPKQKSIQKCLRHLCQTEPYRMLREWSYEMNCDPLSDLEGDPTDVSLDTSY